ncbi:heme utilization cystosolic carrier protein HutX [Bosea sp. PAMC 26642]|uniref:heme utilization cystosolic carrier protein HutX n=1 Tax=Bosea sp. (strain PAMC 26642) TaxID=1792307 RepID=UPI0007702578|nr:heme utilization cystosolic carrier protein HutX [Bosea sp. PAMC 26642]AMJ62046.1 heme utilization protein HuvX [Bosea sp. PAMC 26642]
MTTAEATTRDPMEHVRELLAAKPDGLIEAIAREAGVSTRTVLDQLPAEQRLLIAPERFEELWQNLATWGTVLFLMHTPDVVLECEGSLPVGSFGHGYYNIHGDSPIGGHIKAENCRAIYLVDRKTAQGRRACSVQFYNGAGDVMFKVFVRRDKARELLADQLARFEALKTWAA